MSGLRRVAPPLLARVSRRGFARWTARQTGSDRFAAFGEGSLIVPPALITGHARIRIGRGVLLNAGAFLSVVSEHLGRDYAPELIIGDRVQFGHDLVIACIGRVEIGEAVLGADRVFIGDTYHEYRDASRAVLDQPLRDPRPVRIGAGAFLGVGCAVLPGVEIGEGAYVGAGAVVTRDVPPRTVVVGNPARAIRRFDGTAWVDAGG